MLHTHTHIHTPPHNEEKNPAVEQLNYTVFVVMSRELERAADLKQSRALPQKREGKRAKGLDEPGRGRHEEGFE